MAAGLVYHDITTATGVTFTVASWVPDTGAPDVGAIPIQVLVNSAGVPLATDAGATGVTVLRAILASNDPAVTALQLIDDWDESDRAKVNMIVGQAGITGGAGAVAANTPRFTVASDDPLIAILGAAADAASATTTIKAALRALVTAFGVTAFDLGSGTGGSRTLRVVLDTASDDAIVSAIAGTVAHDDPNTTNPASVGFHALAHGANPTAVAAGDLTRWNANRAGVPWVIGGHPNVIARHNRISDTDGAQSDAALLSVGAGSKIVLTQLSVKADNNNSGNVPVKIGFGTANVPTPALAGVNGLIIDEDFAAGAGHQVGNGAGIIAIGGDAEDLRVTCDDPAGGFITIGYSYYTIES